MERLFCVIQDETRLHWAAMRKVPKEFDVAVVGAGMFGSAAGRYLSELGADLAVVGPPEPAAGDCAGQRAFGAYFDEARITRRLGWDAVWAATDAVSLDRFRTLESASGVPFFHECGSLVLIAKTIAARTDAMVDHCARTSIPIERLSEASLSARLPFLGLPRLPGGLEGLYEERMAGYLNPRQLVKAQLLLAARAGATLLRVAVVDISRDRRSKTWRLRTEAKGQASEITAQKVLIATGAYTNHNDVLPRGLKLALRAFAEPNLLFEVAESQVGRFRSMPSVVTVDPDNRGNDNMSVYLLPPVKYPDGRWYARIGPGMQPLVRELRTVEEMNVWYSRQQVLADQAAFLNRMKGILMPDLTPLSVRGACCIVEKTPSRYPFIGRVGEDEGLTVVVGGNGHGARGSDEIGRLAAGEVLERPWDSDIAQETFKPIIASDNAGEVERFDFLKPPFGLC